VDLLDECEKGEAGQAVPENADMILGTGDGGGNMMQQGAQQGHQSIGGGGDGWQHPEGLDPRNAALAAAERRQGTEALAAAAAAAGTADDAIVID
jgi:hypothetical protein